MPSQPAGTIGRRDFIKIGTGALGAGLVLGTPAAWAQSQQTPQKPAKPRTNIDDAMKIPRTERSLPGAWPGRVVQISDPQSIREGTIDPGKVDTLFRKGLTTLSGQSEEETFRRLFSPADIVGIKVNPVGAGIISTHLEVVDSVVDWLTRCGLPRRQIIIWDRFDYMLQQAGFTPERYPGIRCLGLQTMDEEAAEGKKEDQSAWLKPDGTHVSADQFDRKVFYWADVEGPKDLPYLNQHVFNGKHSYFGKLLTQTLTRIINIPVFKNTGNGISMATKNLGYGAICNTNRLHRPLFFDVCTEVLAFPAIRDKLALNITDALKGQYDGGPMPAPQFQYEMGTLFLASDPFALDAACHPLMVAKRKSMGIRVNEHPMYTEYLRYAERLGLGVVNPQKTTTLSVQV